MTNQTYYLLIINKEISLKSFN